jgi:AcrR family transcriptional regulator
MDLRKKRTQRSIINAFIELRAKKPLEKITVKELADTALIHKATFYQYYPDIYALSDCLEDEALEAILRDITSPDELFLTPKESSLRLYHAILSQGELFFILFSGSRQNVLLDKLEKRLKENICARFPQYRNNLEFDILMTVLIQGCSHAFLNYRQQNPEQVIEILGQASERLLVYKNEKPFL